MIEEELLKESKQGYHKSLEEELSITQIKDEESHRLLEQNLFGRLKSCHSPRSQVLSKNLRKLLDQVLLYCINLKIKSLLNIASKFPLWS